MPQAKPSVSEAVTEVYWFIRPVVGAIEFLTSVCRSHWDERVIGAEHVERNRWSVKHLIFSLHLRIRLRSSSNIHEYDSFRLLFVILNENSGLFYTQLLYCTYR